jgi:hypothetical protein
MTTPNDPLQSLEHLSAPQLRLLTVTGPSVVYR